jgi:putative copper export protein
MHDLAIVLHLILFAYWLGGDLGVFYASRFVTRPDLSAEARGVATRVMDVVDMSPRICLVLILPSGVTLMAASDYGRDIFGGWPLVAVWVAALAWLALVIADHRRRPDRLGALVHRTDLVIRFVLVLGLCGTAVYAFAAARPFGVTTNPDWLAGKVAAYALCIACGLAIRIRVAPFGPAWTELVRTGSSPEVEARIRSSVRGTLPFVYAIWTLVVVAAVLGVVQPGSTAP